MSECDCHIEVTNKAQKKVLVRVLTINSAMFLFEIILGWYAQSTALIADSMDMLADATVYAIGLYAIGKSNEHKANAALVSGYFQLGLGIVIIVDIIRRIVLGSEPVPGMIMAVSVVALIANIICLKLIDEHKEGEVHMRASWVFSKNDVIANIGVLLGGSLVWLTGLRWPDLIIGTVIAMIILKGARYIIRDAKNEQLAISSS